MRLSDDMLAKALPVLLFGVVPEESCWMRLCGQV
jgi:hypothetical protein